MTVDEGIAARLQRMTDTKKQSPDAHGMNKDPTQLGVTESWLADVFEMDIKLVKARLKNCPTRRVRQRGKTFVTKYYDIKDAAAFLVTPVVSTADVLRELKRGQLPPALQQSVWDALLKRQTWEERAGQLWRTEKVREVLGTTFQSIKFTTQLWAETVERSSELSPAQREIIVNMSDALLSEIYEALVKRASEGGTGPQLSEMHEYVGEDQSVPDIIEQVEMDESEIDEDIERLV